VDGVGRKQVPHFAVELRGEVLFGAMISVGRPQAWMTFATVNVLPLPVIPSRSARHARFEGAHQLRNCLRLITLRVNLTQFESTGHGATFCRSLPGVLQGDG
jgi:hypothetical protein